MKNILVIIGHRGIGDLIYHLPLLRSLHQTYKKKIILISNKVNKAKDVYRYEKFYSEILEFDHNRYSFTKSINKILTFKSLINSFNPDLTILTSNSSRLVIPVYFSNSKKKIIFDKKKFFLITNKGNTLLTSSEKLHKHTKKLCLESNFINNFYLDSTEIKRVKINDDYSKKIFINLDSHHDQNNWKIENFINLIKIFLTYDFKIFINFSPSKFEYFNVHLNEFLNNNKITLIYKKNITEIIEIINFCDVVVGNESGPICLGASLKKEVHSIYLPKHTRPESQIINKEINYYNADLLNGEKITNEILRSIINKD
tara:strand:+ start:1036 stop:1977 length:942 start_codon:yes stop_codon:yes gene_type:complete